MFLTIFTPTYSRKNTIPRLYDSLTKQTCKDFEWLVVDDGSTDGTESLISDYMADGIIAISLIKKKNGGKHTAHNTALKYIQGEYFFTVDSDDWLPIDAVEKIKNIIDNNLPTLEASDIAGLLALKALENGNIINRPFSNNCCISSLYNLEHSGNGGERSIIFKSNVIRQYSFPIIPGERFMTESVIYDRIGETYNFFVVNEGLTICEYQVDGLSSNPKRLMFNNPGGYAIYFMQRANNAKSFCEIFKYIVQVNCFKFIYNGDMRLLGKSKHPLLYLLTKPLGYIASMHYKSYAR